LSFGFDDEEGVGGEWPELRNCWRASSRVAAWTEKITDAVLAADEVEAAFLLDELEVGGHGRALTGARLPT